MALDHDGQVQSVREGCEMLVKQHFETHPYQRFELKEFTPPDDGLLQEFFPSDATLYGDPKRDEYPSLLLHGLQNNHYMYTRKVYEHIEANKGRTIGLYGTSGAGKTRSVLEYLSRNLGLYFVASTKHDAGSRDLEKTLEMFRFRNIECTVDGHSQDDTSHYKKLSEKNYETMEFYLYIMVFVRNLVYKAIKEQLGAELDAFQWLLIQLYPEEALKVCDTDDYEGDLFSCATQLGIHLFHEQKLNGKIDKSAGVAMTSPGMPQWHVLVVDETQVLKDILGGFFLSSDGQRERSAFSAVLAGLEKLALCCYNNYGHPVFAGTSMSIEDFEDVDTAKSNIIAKGIGSAGPFSIFDNFAPFQAEDVKEYLCSVLDLEKKDIDEAVLRHLCKWLRGRPRWTASFLEAYLVRKKREEFEATRGSYSPSSAKLLEALDRYLAVYTRDPKTTDGRRGSFTPEKGSPFKAMRDAVERYAKDDLGGTLQRAVIQFAVSGEEVVIHENDARLIEVGLAAIRVDGRGPRTVLDEPIMVETGINFFSLKGSALRNLPVQEKGGQGEAFEKIMLPAIQDNLAKVLGKQHQEENHVLSQYRVSAKSAYGVLAAASGKVDIGKTINWLTQATSYEKTTARPGTCADDEPSAERPTKKRKLTKHGWLSTISCDNAEDFFDAGAVDVFKALKGKD